MKANPLVIALIVLALLGGAVWYTQENPPASDEEESPTLVEAEAAEIQQITIQKPDGESITVVQGEGDEWTFGAGIDVRASDSEIDLMATNLAGLEADRLVEENVEDWRPYGLETPGNLAVTMTPKEGSPVKIYFGNETPTGSGVFARLEGDPRLFTVFNYVKTNFEKELFDLRDKKLVDVDAAEIESVKVDLGSRSYALARKEDQWRLTAPGAYRADDFTAGDVARSVQNAEMTEVLAEDVEAAEGYSFARPYAEVEIVDDSGSHGLTIARSGDDEYYAKSTDQPGVYAVSSTMAEGLDKSLEDLRNKKLFDFGFQSVTSVEIRDGDTSATIEKREDQWALASGGDRELDSEKVQTLIDALRNLAAVGFASDRAGDQARYGLSDPEIVATVVRESGEPETVKLSSLAGDAVHAAREGEPTTYEIEKAPAEELRRALEAVLEEPQPDDETP